MANYAILVYVSRNKQLSGKEFCFLRGEMGMSITKVAQKIDISVKTLKQWEHDKWTLNKKA